MITINFSLSEDSHLRTCWSDYAFCAQGRVCESIYCSAGEILLHNLILSPNYIKQNNTTGHRCMNDFWFDFQNSLYERQAIIHLLEPQTLTPGVNNVFRQDWLSELVGKRQWLLHCGSDTFIHSLILIPSVQRAHVHSRPLLIVTAHLFTFIFIFVSVHVGSLTLEVLNHHWRRCPCQTPPL